MRTMCVPKFVLTAFVLLCILPLSLQAVSWKQITTSGSPLARCDFTLTTNGEDELYVFGGNQANFSDWNILAGFQKLNVNERAWIDVHSEWTPLPVMRHVSEYLSDSDTLVLFSGARREEDDPVGPLFFIEQTLMYQDNKWSNVTHCCSKPLPPAREFGMSVNTGKDLYLFGGHHRGGFLDDMWRYSLEDNEWEFVTPDGDAPLPTASGVLVYDEKTDSIILFGGRNCFRYANCVVSTLYSFNIQSHSWTKLEVAGKEAPKGVSLAAGAIVNGVLYVYGGEENDFGDQLDDLWSFNLATRVWEEVPLQVTPGGRVMHKMVTIGDKVYLHGGFDKDNWVYYSDLWELS